MEKWKKSMEKTKHGKKVTLLPPGKNVTPGKLYIYLYILGVNDLTTVSNFSIFHFPYRSIDLYGKMETWLTQGKPYYI